MGFRLPVLLKRTALGAALLTGALALLPANVGAQAPASAALFPVTTGSPGTGLVSLSGYNTVAVTINGVGSGSTFNVFTCVGYAATPTPAACQIAGAIFANSGGQATGTVPSTVTTSAIAEVFVQNANNSNELYEAVFNGGYAGQTGTLPSCTTGSVVVLMNGLPVCANGLSSLAGCAQVVYIGTSAVCVSSVGPGLSVPWWWYYLYGYGYGFGVLPPGVTYYTSCPPGAGLVPVYVNGIFVLENC